MKRLILTNDSSAAGSLGAARLANFRIALERQLVWGQLPSDVELSGFFGARKKRQAKLHWLDYVPPWHLEQIKATGAGLVELCARFDTIELWMDPRPNDQLQLICLLHYLRAHPEIASKLSLVQARVPMGGQTPDVLAKWKLPAVKISDDHFELASRAWRALGAATPQDWFSLLTRDLSLLPRLRNAVTRCSKSFLGATLALAQRKCGCSNSHREGRRHHAMSSFIGRANSGRLFGYWETGALLDGLARCRKLLLSGLKDGPFSMELHDDRARHGRYSKSKLALTPLGYAILAQTDDFARHNPIRRWWGGTKLTNAHLWRWDPDNQVLVAP